AAPVVGDAELVEDDPIAILHAHTAKLFMHVNTYILHGGFTSCASAPGGNHPSALVGGHVDSRSTPAQSKNRPHTGHVLGGPADAHPPPTPPSQKKFFISSKKCNIIDTLACKDKIKEGTQPRNSIPLLNLTKASGALKLAEF
ncbi:MAG: hypothetical protein ACTSSA_13015, partial [Candidatus Freyarchaeota archaeon]